MDPAPIVGGDQVNLTKFVPTTMSVTNGFIMPGATEAMIVKLGELVVPFPYTLKGVIAKT